MKLKILSITLLVLMFLPVSVLATVASSSTIYNGIDVSNWQGYINYSEVKANGINIVYIKSSQGNNIVDAYFKINYENAKANGLQVGFYHFLTARSKEEAIKQADFFVSTISNTVPDCKLAMDFEQFGNLNIEQINNISEAFLQRVIELTGKEVIIYSDASNAKNIFGKNLALKYPLWIAEYGVEVPRNTNWEFWDGFQYTSSGRVNGIEGLVDRDKFTENILLSNNAEIPETPEMEKPEPEVPEKENPQNPSKDTTYIVKKGNTLSQIARKYGTTVKELVSLNNIRNPNLIFPNQKIIVPINSNMQDDNLYDCNHIIYTVKKGDTLSKLAIKFKTTIKEIAKLNDIQNVNLIFTGEKLRIEI